ncbi:MAG TPA: rod shape-determining protein MreC [Gaiellaceae bacterium]
MPRNRTVPAVLGSSVQRSAASGYPTSRSGALKRRIVVGGLILLSLVLITVSFRSTALDPAQGFVASVLRPFEVAGARVSQPFRDAVGWTRGLFHAKSENARLKKEIEELRRQQILYESAVQANVHLRNLLRYRAAPTLADFRKVAAQVLASPPNSFDQRIVVAAGANDGVAKENVVVTDDGLVGTVTRVFARVSQVTLITDHDSSVRATILTNPTAVGQVRHGTGIDTLVLDRVPKSKFVGRGSVVVTAGSPGGGQLPSLYPRNIEIGKVTSVSTLDTETFLQIQVDPFVDFSSLQSVLVLVPKKR